jgi:hypothetical protein
MNATIITPDVNLSNRSHILDKDKTAMKYVTCAQIQTELHLLCEAVRKAGANIIIPRREVKSKTDLMDLYGYLYRECEKYNAEVLAERQAKVEQESAERALKSSNRHERKAARLSDAEERFTRYSDELAKREAGDMMGLDAKGQKHRIASLKRKIARAEVSMKKLQENS